MTRAAKRQVARLLNDARTIAIDLITDSELAPQAIVACTYPLIQHAARISTRVYAPAEATAVRERFEQRMSELEEVVG